MIVDASVILKAYFPDEEQGQAQALIGKHVARKIILRAPTILVYELSNAVWQGERRNRISREKADEMIQSFEGLQIRLETIDWGEMLPLARRFDRSAYDASYLALAESSGEPFITGDKRLYNAVHADLNWVQWIGDYS